MSNDKLLRLLRGEEADLHAIDPGLHKVHIGLGWSAPKENDGAPVDLDASAFLLGHGERVRWDTDFIFYNNPEIENGVVRHLGDNLTGGAQGGDCEAIEIDLDSISFDVEKIVFCVTIHNSHERQQHFGFVKDAYIRILNLETKVELTRFDLTHDARSEDAFIFGELYRMGGTGWRFKAIGLGVEGGLYKIAKDFNVNVAPIF